MIWLARDSIIEALSPDPLSEAKEKVQTRRIRAIVNERKALVHAALRAGVVPTQPGSPSCSGQVAS